MSGSVTRVPGILKTEPEDFVVVEIPAYEPSGEGDHVYVRFRKRDMTTDDAVRAIASAAGCEPRDVGVAGMKDKRAVTEQTISLAPPRGTKASELERTVSSLIVPGIDLLEVKRHANKLKTGHLHGNRFTIRIRKIPTARAGDLLAGFEAIAKSGVPNAFGEQRFGKGKDNAQRGLAIVRGEEAPPRDRRLLRLLYSSLQSKVFNDVLAERVTRGTWNTAMLGDVLKKEETGGLFVCTDEQQDSERAAAHELSATGPMFGPKCMQPTHVPLEIEREILARNLGDDFENRYMPALGEGTRRAFRLPVSELSCNLVANATEEETSCIVEFVLPKGAFATTVLEQVVGS